MYIHSCPKPIELFSSFTPKDYSDEWQDLDDLLEDALEGAEDLTGTTTATTVVVQVVRTNPSASSFPTNESQVNAKLSQVDALLVADAESIAAGGREAGTTRFEQAGIQATDAMEAFIGGRGETTDGSASNQRLPGSAGLGDEEERLLQMVCLLRSRVTVDWLLTYCVLEGGRQDLFFECLCDGIHSNAGSLTFLSEHLCLLVLVLTLPRGQPKNPAFVLLNAVRVPLLYYCTFVWVSVGVEGFT